LGLNTESVKKVKLSVELSTHVCEEAFHYESRPTSSGCQALARDFVPIEHQQGLSKRDPFQQRWLTIPAVSRPKYTQRFRNRSRKELIGLYRNANTNSPKYCVQDARSNIRRNCVHHHVIVHDIGNISSESVSWMIYCSFGQEPTTQNLQVISLYKRYIRKETISLNRHSPHPIQQCQELRLRTCPPLADTGCCRELLLLLLEIQKDCHNGRPLGSPQFGPRLLYYDLIRKSMLRKTYRTYKTK
jgi:hypothetical protein